LTQQTEGAKGPSFFVFLTMGIRVVAVQKQRKHHEEQLALDFDDPVPF
jgi:hypothetical protein